MVSVAVDSATPVRTRRAGFFSKVGTMKRKLTSEERAELSAAVERMRDAADAVVDAHDVAGPILAAADDDYEAEGAWMEARAALIAAHGRMLAVLRAQFGR